MMMTNRAKIEPRGESRRRPRPTRMTLAPLRRSSSDISMTTRFLRTMTPTKPMAKSRRPRTMTASIGIMDELPPGNDDGADEHGQEQDRGQLEGEKIGAEQRLGHRGESMALGAARGGGESPCDQEIRHLDADCDGDGDEHELGQEGPALGEDLLEVDDDDDEDVEDD